MIVPPKIADKIEADKQLRNLFIKFPLAFFGDVIRYPKQASIIRAWLEHRPKITIITGWKRTGKTQIAAYLGSCWLYGVTNRKWPGARAMGIKDTYLWRKRLHGQRVGMIGGKSMDHVENVLLKMYQDLFPPGSVREWFSRSKHMIRAYDGSKMIVRTYDQDLETWKSGEAQFIHLDEEPPWPVMAEVLERSRTTKGRILITVAVDDADVSWLPDALQAPERVFGTSSVAHFKIGVEDVPDVLYPPEEKEIVYKQYDDTPMRNAVRKGEFVYMSGRWWPEFQEKHVIKPFKIPEHWKRYRFIDAGVAAPTACIWIAIHPSGFLIVYDEYYKTGTLIAERCREIIEQSGNLRIRDGGIWVEKEVTEHYEMTMLDHAEFKKDQVTGDGVDYEYLANGLAVVPWTTLGQEARREITRKFLWIDMKENHFITHEPGAPRLYIFDTCVNLIWEAKKKCFKKTMSLKSGILEKKVENRDDHAMDCVEAACCELRWIVDNREMI